ncbi:MAG TPA: NADH-quinone oxidoreductase subunit C [Acidimicrobiales bacterium]
MSDTAGGAETDVAEETGTNGAADPEAQEQGPRDEVREAQLAVVTDALGDRVLGSHIAPGLELWVRVDRADWRAAVELAKVKLGCTFFDFLSGIDWAPSPWGRYEDALDEPSTNGSGPATSGGIPPIDPATIEQGYAGGETRFQVFTRLVNVKNHTSVVLKVDVPEDDLTVPSITKLFAGANWHERECWEMFGISFEGHPSLRHLYLPSGFEGHPLRKDFPLVARMVKPWPGIVDVEPMPATEEPEAPAEGEGGDAATTEEGGDQA